MILLGLLLPMKIIVFVLLRLKSHGCCAVSAHESHESRSSNTTVMIYVLLPVPFCEGKACLRGKGGCPEPVCEAWGWDGFPAQGFEASQC